MKSTTRWSVCLVLLLGGLAIDAGAQQPPNGDPMVTGPAPKGKAWEPAWGFWPDVPKAWQQTHWGFVKQTRQGGVDVLFLGDSITKGWSGAGKEIWKEHYEPMKALNIGIGGDTTRQTLWRIDHEALDGIRPKVIVLMIGVNNIFTGTGSDEEIVKGIDEILKQISAKQPASKVLLLGILPLGNEQQSARASRINAELAKRESKSVRFMDLRKEFVGEDGKVRPELYRKDLVHLEAPGYKAWDQAMRPALMEMLK